MKFRGQISVRVNPSQKLRVRDVMKIERRAGRMVNMGDIVRSALIEYLDAHFPTPPVPTAPAANPEPQTVEQAA